MSRLVFMSLVLARPAFLFVSRHVGCWRICNLPVCLMNMGTYLLGVWHRLSFVTESYRPALPVSVAIALSYRCYDYRKAGSHEREVVITALFLFFFTPYCRDHLPDIGLRLVPNRSLACDVARPRNTGKLDALEGPGITFKQSKINKLINWKTVQT